MERIHVSVRGRPLSQEDAKSSPWRSPAALPSFPTSRPSLKSGLFLHMVQSSSGKTHTMRGSTTEPGVIPMAVQDLFNSIEEEMDREFLLRCRIWKSIMRR